MTEIQRNWRGQPMVVPPDGGKPRPYNRSSSFGGVLEDTYHLSRWQQRMAVKGLALRPDLYLAASATPLEAKSKLNEIAEQAIEHAGGSRASTTGTALHTLTELMDRGEPLPAFPTEFADDLRAYEAATARWRMIHIESFMVCDELEVAGTPDRLMAEATDAPHIEQRDGHGPQLIHDPLVVGDLKTGASSGFMDKHSVQLAVYAHSVLYDPATGARTPVAIDQKTAYVFHMPAGEGRCDLYELDIQAGWEGALLARDVRQWRKRKGLAVPFPRAA